MGVRYDVFEAVPCCAVVAWGEVSSRCWESSRWRASQQIEGESGMERDRYSQEEGDARLNLQEGSFVCDRPVPEIFTLKHCEHLIYTALNILLVPTHKTRAKSRGDAAILVLLTGFITNSKYPLYVFQSCVLPHTLHTNLPLFAEHINF